MRSPPTLSPPKNLERAPDGMNGILLQFYLFPKNLQSIYYSSIRLLPISNKSSKGMLSKCAQHASSPCRFVAMEIAPS